MFGFLMAILYILIATKIIFFLFLFTIIANNAIVKPLFQLKKAK